MTTKIPVYEAKIMNTDNTGIFALSFVEVPANEHNFVALKTAARLTKLQVNRQKQILTGVVLVPDQLIYRYDESLGEYYLKFTAADIEKIAAKMMRTGIALSTTTHQHEKPLKDNFLTELWIVADPKRDKAVALGLGELPIGTLCCSYKIGNAGYWQREVLSGKVKGFSIEGIFNYNNVQMKKQTVKPNTPVKKSAGVVSFLKAMTAMLEGDTVDAADALVDEAKKDEVDAGTPFLVFTLADGSEVWVDEDGYATIDGEAAPAGEHALDDGNFIVIDDSGMLVVTAEEAAGVAPDEAAVALAKQRGKDYLKKQVDPKTAQINKLKKQLAELEKQPSTAKVTPTTTTAEKDIKDMTYTEKMAAVIRSRQAGRSARKAAAPAKPATK